MTRCFACLEKIEGEVFLREMKSNVTGNVIEMPHHDDCPE